MTIDNKNSILNVFVSDLYLKYPQSHRRIKREHMTIQNWRIFITVCECGSITTAANQLYMAQSAVSRSIIEIENFYNIQLFDRRNRKIQLTSAGEAILGYARDILNNYALMENYIRGIESHMVLRIGASTSFTKFILNQAFPAFQSQYPFIETKMSIDLSSSLEKKVIAGDIDIAFIERPPSVSTLKILKIPGDQLCLFCSAKHPLAKKEILVFQDLKDYGFCLKMPGQSSRDLFDAFCLLNGYRIQSIYESIVSYGLAESVRDSDRIGVLSFWGLKTSKIMDQLKILNVSDVLLKRDYYILTRDGYNLSKMKADRLIELSKGIAAKQYESMRQFFLEKGIRTVEPLSK